MSKTLAKFYQTFQPLSSGGLLQNVLAKTTYIYKQYWKCAIIGDMITNNNTEDMGTNMKTGQFSGFGAGSIYQSVVGSGEKTGFSVDW